jgi:dipeptidyl aminopeptidase/acylaminoacyl peptidase
VIGQHPDFFSAAVLRNAVISCGQLGNSDIPDWYFKQFGLDYGPTSEITPSEYEFLFNASPIAHVDSIRIDSIRTPVLLFVGLEDRRVAQMQTISFYHALKGRGKKVELLCIPKVGHNFLELKAAKLFYEAGRDWIKNACH